jgi:16S rRNA (guanine966-N2)-methyltransferase
MTGSRCCYHFPMRVISGIYGGRVLRGPSGARTRPTSDRLRETLFNILAPQIAEDTSFLDLCAGTGAVGIEAASRGAGFVTFVDKSRRACGLIEENLDTLKVPEEKTEIFCSEAERFLLKNPGSSWDIAFFDPPYAESYNEVLEIFGQQGANPLRADGVLVVEHHSKNFVPDEVGELRRWRLLKQGETCLSFFERG